MPVLPLCQPAAEIGLPLESTPGRRPLSQSMIVGAAWLSSSPWTVGQPVEWLVPVMSTSTTA